MKDLLLIVLSGMQMVIACSLAAVRNLRLFHVLIKMRVIFVVHTHVVIVVSRLIVTREMQTDIVLQALVVGKVGRMVWSHV